MSTSADTFAIVGCGGLGGPAALALASAGAALVLIDDDVVELSNLQRQVQFVTRDIGRPKVDALADALAARGVPPQRITTHRQRLNAHSAAELLGGADVAVDGSDNFATKFAVNDACVATNTAAAIGAVHRSEGQIVAVSPGGPCYRCLFEEPPTGDDPASCAQAGVIGAACGAVAGRLARTALELAAGRRPPPLVVFPDLAAAHSPREIHFEKRKDCPACTQAGPDPRYDPGRGTPALPVTTQGAS